MSTIHEKIKKQAIRFMEEAEDEGEGLAMILITETGDVQILANKIKKFTAVGGFSCALNRFVEDDC